LAADIAVDAAVDLWELVHQAGRNVGARGVEVDATLMAVGPDLLNGSRKEASVYLPAFGGRLGGVDSYGGGAEILHEMPHDPGQHVDVVRAGSDQNGKLSTSLPEPGDSLHHSVIGSPA